MVRLFIYIVLFITFTSFVKDSSRIKHTYSDKSYTCYYETENGIINGKYISYYKNGRIRSKGCFLNNYREGTWKVWDSTGIYYTERKYQNPFVYERIKPSLPKNKLVDLIDVPVYSINYNKYQYIDLFYLHERAVYWAKRVWRFIPKQNNDDNFSSIELLNLIYENGSKDSIQLYKDDEFITKIIDIKLDTIQNKIVGYKIKEDAIFDSDRYLYENRIIGICPVFVNKETKDTLDLYWVYFPQLRKCLAKNIVKKNRKYSYIKSYDDLFFYRHFYSTIYKTGWVSDINIQIAQPLFKSNEKAEIDLIETEHDLWLKFIR